MISAQILLGTFEVDQGTYLMVQAPWFSCLQENRREVQRPVGQTSFHSSNPKATLLHWMLASGHAAYHIGGLLSSEQKPELHALFWKDLSPVSSLLLLLGPVKCDHCVAVCIALL